MRRAYKLLILGIWVAILPYLGFPYFWKNILITLSGFGIVYASFMLYQESKTKEEKDFDNFSENEFPDKEETQ